MADDQPRDEKGRFASTGGGSAKAWAQGHAPGDRQSGGRHWTDERQAGKTAETYQEHFTGHPDEGGKPTPERAAMHERDIIGPAFAGKKTAAELGEKPTAILTMGGPASGKGVLLGKLKDAGVETHEFVHVDPDEVKAKLPEYKKSVPQHGHEGPTYRGAAAQVHEESSYVAKQIRDRAIEAGHHVIIDGTGGNAPAFKGLISHLENKGYDVHVHYAHSDADTGVERAAARAEGSGRYVPEHVIRGTYGKIQKALPEIMAHAKNFHMYDAKASTGHPLVYSHTEAHGAAEHAPGFLKKVGVAKGRG